MQRYFGYHRGATLAELMVAIAIIVFLSSLAITILQSTQAKARDTIRANDLQLIDKALQIYYQDNGQYPATEGQWWGTCAEDACHGDWGVVTADWIPDLSPRYISYLPLDPLPDNCLGRCYLYRSDGQDYKVLAQFVERPFDQIYTTLIDPYRDGTFEDPQEQCVQNPTSEAFGWSIYSPTAKCW